MADPAVELAVAETVRAHPSNVFLRDAFCSGIGGREPALLARLVGVAAWNPDDVDANAILSALARGIVTSRKTAAIEDLISLVLHGVRGAINVLGRIYTGEMPALGALHDEQVSSMLAYVRRAWGHTASPIDPEHVRSIRARTVDRTDAWSALELSRIE